jgi:hypothetical protein
MSPSSISALFVFLSLLLVEPAKEKTVTYVDLQPKTNQKLKEPFHGSTDANNLAELKQGKQTLDGLKFNIGEGLIQLANENLKATGHSVDDDTVIAKYLVHYADKSTETIEIAYGKDVRDWWHHDDDKDPTRGKVAWKGSNEAAKSGGSSIWLFSLTWKNPKPDKKVVSIDYVSTLTEAAPFVVAMTLEEE